MEEQKEKGRKAKAESEKIKLSTLIYGIIALGVILFLIFSLFIYRFDGAKKLSKNLKNNIFLPAIIINKTNFISVGAINENLTSIRNFYESQDYADLGYRIDFETQDGIKRLKLREKELINKMIEDKAVEILAKKRGINITDKIVDDNVDRKMDEYGNQESIAVNLKKNYGWSLDDFKDKIVKTSLFKDELEKWVEENDGRDKKEKAKQAAVVAEERLKKGEAFEAVAKSVSEGGTANKGGKLGWFKEDQISKEIRLDVVALKKGSYSEILESNLGYHVIKLEDIKEVDGEKLFNISQLFFPKLSLAVWLDAEIKKMKVSVLLNDYNWNKDTGLVEFKDKSLDEFEKKALSTPSNDPSLINL